MRFKPLPEPPADLDEVEAFQQAVPLVPGSEDDCCARLMRRRDLPSRDVARTWLTFLRALELAVETDSGFRRTDREPTPANLRESFVANVFSAEEVLETLRSATEPLSDEAAYEAIADTVPNWERHKVRTWEADWRQRISDLLAWLVVLDLAAATPDGYVAVE
jgi:hypothetical protein